MNTTLQNQSVPEVKSPVVSLSDVTKIYGRGDTRVRALKGIDLVINKGEFTSIMGPSGSGKSTMLHVIAGLDNPTKGVVTVDGIDITHLKDKELTELRRSRIGFIFQSFNLVPTLNVEDNILLPMQLSNQKIDKEWMSRALVARPAIIVADEPTGNLDSKTSDEVLSILRQAVDEFGQSVIMVTHNPAVASVSDRVIVVSDGFIKADMVGATPDRVVSLL